MLKFLLLAGSSFVLGAAHALEPGHGKTVVGAYLIGSRGRVRDAIVLGLVVTLTHSGSVILLGVLSTAAATMFMPQTVQRVLEVVAGLMVLGVGAWMLATRVWARSRGRARDGHHHHHAHDHCHGEAHAAVHEPGATPHADHPGHAHNGHSHAPVAASAERPSLGQLVLLGISGGIVLCPAALAVLLAAATYGQFLRGLSLVLVFSLGMALVLVAVGITMVKAAGWAGRYVGESRWMSALPVVSAGLITVLGLGLTAKALLDLAGR